MVSCRHSVHHHCNRAFQLSHKSGAEQEGDDCRHNGDSVQRRSRPRIHFHIRNGCQRGCDCDSHKPDSTVPAYPLFHNKEGHHAAAQAEKGRLTRIPCFEDCEIRHLPVHNHSNRQPADDSSKYDALTLRRNGGGPPDNGICDNTVVPSSGDESPWRHHRRVPGSHKLQLWSGKG